MKYHWLGCGEMGEWEKVLDVIVDYYYYYSSSSIHLISEIEKEKMEEIIGLE